MILSLNILAHAFNSIDKEHVHECINNFMFAIALISLFISSKKSQTKHTFKFSFSFDDSKLKSLKSALRNFVLNAMKMESLNIDEQGLLQALCIDAKALNIFVDACQQDFGELFTAKGNIKWQSENFDSYEKLVQYFAQNALTVFYNELAKKCEDLSAKKPMTSEAPAPVILPMPAAAPLLFSRSKKLRSTRRSEVQLLNSSLNTLRRSARLIEKKKHQNNSIILKKRCQKRLS